MLRTPPPTVSGMKQASAVRLTRSSRMPGDPRALAVNDLFFYFLSEEHNSFRRARPALIKASAHSTGVHRHRADRRNWTPLTTADPSLTSRTGGSDGVFSMAWRIPFDGARIGRRIRKPGNGSNRAGRHDKHPLCGFEGRPRQRRKCPVYRPHGEGTDTVAPPSRKLHQSMLSSG